MAQSKYYLLLTVLLITLGGLISRDLKKNKDEVKSDSPTKSDFSAPSTQKVSASAVPRFSEQAAWANERHWLVDEIVNDTAEMLAFASAKGAFDPGTLKATATPMGSTESPYAIVIESSLGKVEQALQLQHHLWAAENYAPVAKAMMSKWKLTSSAAASASTTDLASKLTQPDTLNLIAESKRVSAALSQQPLDAALHEEAALIIGTLAFREAAGLFCDTRPALGRMTAHLALAQAIRPTTRSISGQLAEVLQLTLIGLQTEALARADTLPAGLDAWRLALRLRNTSDWRLIKEPKTATMLEQIAYVGALACAVGPEPIMRFLESAKPPPLLDWARLALEQNFSVQEGHFFATESVKQEFGASAQLRKAWAGDEISSLPALVAVLNTPASRAVVKPEKGAAHLEVLSWGTLASFQQRHLMHALGRTLYFFREKWGVNEEADALEKMVREQLGALRLQPLLMMACVCDQDAVIAARTKAVAFCERYPQLVTAGVWTELENPPSARSAGPRPAAARGWFGEGLIFGTPFDFCGRDCGLHCLNSMSSETVAALAKAAPYHHHVLRFALQRRHDSGSEAIGAAYKAIADYHLEAAREIADSLQNDPKAYIAAMNKVALLDADQFTTLAEYLVHRGMAEEAATAYQTAFDKAPDRVRMANHCEWLINYYYDHDRKAEAVKIAEEAAEVYSFRGLEAAGHLMEKMERWTEAHDHFAAIAERYNDNGPLLTFLKANKDAHPEVAKEYDKLIKSTFPDELKQVGIADFKDAPADGTVFTSNSNLTQQHEIKVGTVIVALDGYAVHDMAQYNFLRSLTPNAALQLILWDGSAYRELSASVPERRFGCEMETYLKK